MEENIIEQQQEESSYWDTHYKPVCEFMGSEERLLAYDEIRRWHENGSLTVSPSKRTPDWNPLAYHGKSVYNVPQSWFIVTKNFVEEYNLQDKVILIDSTRELYSLEWSEFVSVVKPTEYELKLLVGTKITYPNCSRIQRRRMNAKGIGDYKPTPLNPVFEPTPEIKSWYQRMVGNERLMKINRDVRNLQAEIEFIERILYYFDYIYQSFVEQDFKFKYIKVKLKILIELCIVWDNRKEKILKGISQDIVNTNRRDFQFQEHYYSALEKEFQKIIEIVDVDWIWQFGEREKDLFTRLIGIKALIED